MNKISTLSVILLIILLSCSCNYPISNEQLSDQLTSFAGEVATQVNGASARKETLEGAPAEPVKSTATPAMGMVYQVNEGDTCLLIASAFQVGVNELAKENGLGPDCAIEPGQRLIIPEPSSALPAVPQEIEVTPVEPAGQDATLTPDFSAPESTATRAPEPGNLPAATLEPTRKATVASGGEASNIPTSSVKAQPIPHDDYKESTGCPAGMRCLSAGSFAWPTNSATYCVAPDQGIQVGDKALFGDAGNAIDRYAADGARYWLTNLGFKLVIDNTCTQDTDILIGWSNEHDPHLGVTYVNNLATDQQVIITLGSGLDDAGNILFHWNPTIPDGRGYDGSITMAHELGHAIGLGHDTLPNSLMHPNGTPGVIYSDRYPLGSDIVNQYAAKYLSNNPMLGFAYQKTGISGEYITSNSEVDGRVEKNVPIPKGMENRLGDLRAACTVVSYLPNDDSDFSFYCWYDLQTAHLGYVTFYLDTGFSIQSKVSVYAMVWDNAVFPILNWMHFKMSADRIWVWTWGMPDPNWPPDYALPYNHSMLLPLNTVGDVRGGYLITINQYHTDKSKAFGWDIRDNFNGWLTFNTTLGEGRKHEYVTGDVFVLAWTGQDTAYTNPFGQNSRIDLTYQTICGNYSGLVDTGMDIWQENSSALASIIAYLPGSERDYVYGVSGEAEARAGPNNIVNFETHIFTVDGMASSCVVFENVLFQLGP